MAIDENSFPRAHPFQRFRSHDGPAVTRKSRSCRLCLIVLLIWFALTRSSRAQTVNVADFGVTPDSSRDATSGVARAIVYAKSKSKPVLVFLKGRYEFWPENASKRHYYISNHDAVNSRAVAMPLEDVKNLIIDGQGSAFVFHGVILPISIVHASAITLRNFSIDYATPHVLESEVIRVEDGSVDLKMPASESYVVEDHHICAIAEGWKECLGTSQEFDGTTKAIAWNAHADLDFAKTRAIALAPGIVRVIGMPIEPTLGNRLILWNRDRPDPAIWVSESSGVTVSNVNVFSAIGMGFLAQKSAAIHLDGFRVKLGSDTTRYVTSAADAVHFSSCRGSLVIENGSYENMLDDGINVHGTYLRIAARVAPSTLLLEWTHPQTYGFTFAALREHIQFVKPTTLIGYGLGVVKTVRSIDDQHVEITFANNLPVDVQVNDAVDNIDWQPSVIYRNNIVRHNRSRGSIFKTTKGVLVEGNTFDHLSGPAVLLIADAVDWFESAPASNVVIAGNHFIDQISTYGPAPITINPKVNLSAEPDYYNVSRVVIRDNDFSAFQKPVLVANSVNGLVFRGNTVRLNTDYKPFLPPDASIYSFHHARCVDVEQNHLPWPLSLANVSMQDAKLIHVEGLPEDAGSSQEQLQCREVEESWSEGGNSP